MTGSERLVGEAFRTLIPLRRGRILVVSFASNVHRMQQAIDVAVQVGRKVAIVGRSMRKNLNIARGLGYLDFSRARRGADAIVTPFKRTARSISTASARSRATSSTTAPTASSSPAPRARARRSPTTSASSSTQPRSTRSATARPSSPGTGTYDTRHSVHLTEQAHELGVDAVLIVTPYYSKPPQRGIVAHFEAVAAATDKPVVVYNIPSRVVINIEPETITRLAEIENVRAVKQAYDDLAQARHIVETGLDLYAGDDDLILPFLELGGVGGVCVHTHVVGPQVKEADPALEGGRARRGPRRSTASSRRRSRSCAPPRTRSRSRRP